MILRETASLSAHVPVDLRRTLVVAVANGSSLAAKREPYEQDACRNDRMFG
jgi:hypothetical protein